MSILTIDASVMLKKALVASGVTYPIYTNGERPTKNLPPSFIEIRNNGAMSTNASEYGISTTPLLLFVWTKLIVGTLNEKLENLVVKQFETSLLSGIKIENIRFELNKTSMFTALPLFSDGYASKQFNIISTIINT